MKKILLFLLPAMLVGFFANAQVERMVMIESFTQASCGPCASQNPGFNAIIDNNLDNVVVLKYQTSWPGFDPMNLQNPGEVQTRVDYYGVSGVPNVQIDGADYGTSGSVTQGDIDAAYAIPASLEMSLTHELSADLATITITCEVTNPDMMNEFNVADARLRVAIVEENINFPEPPGSTDEKDFKYVMRKMLPDALGTLVGAIGPGETVPYTWTVELPDYIYNYNEIGVVAFVQSQGSKEVYQAAKSEPQPLPGDFPDAAFSTSTAGPNGLCDYNLVPAATVGNEGDIELTSFDVSYTLNGGSPVTESWTGSLMPGQEVTVDFAATTVIPGETVVEYQLENINGGLQDINSLNNLVPAEAFYTLSDTPFGPVLEEDCEDDAIEGTPNNTIVARGSITELMVVNEGWLSGIGATTNGPVGGHGNSDNSLLVGFWWTSPGTETTMTFDKLEWTERINNQVSFDVAYRQYTSENDRLEVEVSTDCGVTWENVYDKAGSTLSSVGASQTFFVPGANDWRSDTVDLSAYDDAAEVVIRFKITAAFGNNMYLDNINLGGEMFSAVEDVIAEGNVNVYPNPATGPVSIDFTMIDADQVSVQIFDVTGKLVETLVDNQLYSAGEYTLEWNNPVNTGLYLVKVTTEAGQVTQKVNVVK